MDSFTVNVRESGPGRFVVAVSGELDLAAADALWTRLEPLIEDRAVIVLDGTGLKFLDSSGLRVLLRAASGARQNGAVFRLVVPEPAVQRVLTLVGADGILETHDDVEAALGS